MYFIYILKSKKHGHCYIGSTNDLSKRLMRHNTGRNKSTKGGVPWIMIHHEVFITRQDAYKREMQIKSYKGGEAFRKLIEK